VWSLEAVVCCVSMIAGCHTWQLNSISFVRFSCLLKVWFVSVVASGGHS